MRGRDRHSRSPGERSAPTTATAHRVSRCAAAFGLLPCALRVPTAHPRCAPNAPLFAGLEVIAAEVRLGSPL